MSLLSSVDGVNAISNSLPAKTMNKSDLLALQDIEKIKNSGKIQVLKAGGISEGVLNENLSSKAVFPSLMSEAIDRVDQAQKTSHQLIREVMAGESDNIHHAMIATQEASVAFTALVEVRNKLMESYQELLRMQA